MAFRSTLQILLLQARVADDPAKTEELHSFAKRCGLKPSQIVSHDLLQGPPSLAAARQFDALMVGGAGDYYVSKRDLPFHDELVDFLGDLVQIGHPMFASCFGFQYMVLALGGEIVYDPENMEVGTFELTLSDAGREDPLFGHLPSSFLAQMGHKDRAADHIDGIPTLTFSERAPVQAIRIPDQPMWATQFHPELDREANLGRYWRYLDGYVATMSEQERESALDSFRHCPATLDLLKRFLDLVFG